MIFGVVVATPLTPPAVALDKSDRGAGYCITIESQVVILSTESLIVLKLGSQICTFYVLEYDKAFLVPTPYTPSSTYPI